jgi:acetolactate synthase I/II/III large subunit
MLDDDGRSWLAFGTISVRSVRASHRPAVALADRLLLLVPERWYRRKDWCLEVFDSLKDEVKVTEAIVDVLADAGVRYVFGIPGGHTVSIFEALINHPSIRVIQVHEESIGSIAAEAYGRMTGQPAVVIGQGEWIVGNAGQGQIEALLGSSPVVILTEMSDGGSLSHHSSYQSGSGDYGSWDAAMALKAITKVVMISHYGAQAVQHTQLALKHALTGEPGPTAVIYHSEALKGTVGPKTRPAIYPTSGYLASGVRGVDDVALRAAVATLERSTRPIIVAGNGVRISRAYDSLVRFAEIIDAPIVTTASGKGAVPETHPLALGVVGTFGNPSAMLGVREADAVIAVGTKLGVVDTWGENMTVINPSRQSIVQIDIEPLNAGWTYPVDHALIGDAGVLLDALSSSLARANRGAVERVAALLGSNNVASSALRSMGPPFSPQHTISVIQEVALSGSVVTCDAGENRLFMMQWFKSLTAGGYLQPAAGGGMGYAVPAAIGAKVACPTRPVVAVCGDGGMAMSLHALMTALQEQLPIGVVVLNNRALGWVVHGMGTQPKAAEAIDYDFARIAKSIGCDGLRPENAEELREGARLCFESTRPFVLDVLTSLDTSYRDLRVIPSFTQPPTV